MRETATYERAELVSTYEALRAFRAALEEGVDWPTALLQAIAEWSTPEETVGDRVYAYFIEGEAFDWLLLAERLFEAADMLIPERPQRIRGRDELSPFVCCLSSLTPMLIPKSLWTMCIMV